MASHLIEIYSFKDFFWHSPDKEYLLPAGRRQRILTMDLGALLPDVAEVLNTTDQHKPRKKYSKEDNLKGSRKLRLPQSLHNLEAYMISTFEFHDEEVYYYFTLRKDAITVKQPLEIYITEYLADNKELVSFSREKIQVWAKKWRNTNLPLKNFELRYFETSLPLSKPNSISEKS